MVKLLPTKEVVSSTIEFLLRQLDNDPVALLQAVAQYSVVTRAGRASSICSQECLLKVALKAEEACSQCWKLSVSTPVRKASVQIGDQSSSEQSNLVERKDTLVPRSSGALGTVGKDEVLVAAERDEGLASMEPSASVDPAKPSFGTERVLLQSLNHSTISEDASGTSGAIVKTTRTEEKIQSPKEDISILSGRRERQSDSKPASPPVPRLLLEDLSKSEAARGGTRVSSISFRLSQSARGMRPQPMHSPRQSGGKSVRSSLSGGLRPHTAVNERGQGVKDVQSEENSPAAAVRVKALMTPDDHIKEWLVEKRKKEAQRERRIRRRQLAELEFIASLRRTQARRLRHIEDEEKKLALAASAIEPLFKAQSAQARYRGLKGPTDWALG